MHDPVAYTYEAAMHCPGCARARFGDDPVRMPVIPFDREGNEVGAVYSWEEGTAGESCDDCHELLAESDRPTAPYAVMSGLDGGYLPSTCHHYATLEDALPSLADDLEFAANGLLDTGDMLDGEECSILDDLWNAAAKIRSAIASGEIAAYAPGDTWPIARYESISLVSIAPEDYEAGDD